METIERKYESYTNRQLVIELNQIVNTIQALKELLTDGPLERLKAQGQLICDEMNIRGI